MQHNQHNSETFRSHIAGLRAIAVLGVVLFHFGATWLPGGFMGVDVFFVISGFLISRSIFREVDAQTFSLLGFYERRARRIFPALFAVTLATAIAAGVILFPAQLVAFAKSIIAAATFTSNIYFYASTSYFSPAATEIPLLHYWSLGVEEQFYLFFPLLILAISRFVRRALPVILVLLLVTSLIACEWMLRVAPSAAFYLLPFRAFELLLGSVLALKGMPFPKSRTLGMLAAAGGLLVLLAGFLVIDENYRFPGLVALVPCLGSALIIWGGERVTSWPTRLLSTPPMTFLGAISYSLYLVHWPILVFWTAVQPAVDPLVLLIGGTLASVGLAWLSWRFIEQPVRERRALFSRPVVLWMSCLGLAVLAGAAFPVIQAEGWPGRQDAEVQRLLAAYNVDRQYIFRGGTCFLDPDQSYTDLRTDECLVGGHPDVLLWGSSRVAQFYRGLQPLLAERGLTLGQITASACPPHLGRDIGGRPHCRSLNDYVIANIAAIHPKLVIIGGDGLSGEEELLGLDRTIEALNQAGIPTVVLGQMVTHRLPVPNLLAQRMIDGNRSLLSGDDVVDYLAAATDGAIKRYRDDKRITFISPKGDLCSAEGCVLENDGQVLFFDEDHYTVEGSRYYAKKLLSLIEPVLK